MKCSISPDIGMNLVVGLLRDQVLDVALVHQLWHGGGCVSPETRAAANTNSLLVTVGTGAAGSG